MSTTPSGSSSDANVLRPTSRGDFPELLPGPLMRFYGTVAMGNGALYTLGAMRVGGGLFVGLLGLGAALFSGPVSPSDVYEKLGLEEPNFADFINDQIQRYPRLPRLGNYVQATCCGEEEENDVY